MDIDLVRGQITSRMVRNVTFFYRDPNGSFYSHGSFFPVSAFDEKHAQPPFQKCSLPNANCERNFLICGIEAAAINMRLQGKINERKAELDMMSAMLKSSASAGPSSK